MANPELLRGERAIAPRVTDCAQQNIDFELAQPFAQTLS
jgi:hypothetical protein